MDIILFSKIVKKLGNNDFNGFKYKHNNVIYGFKDIGEDTWEDDGSGKYQYKYEQGKLIEMDENDNEKQSFDFGISRSTQRCGSYFSGYNFETEKYKMFTIKEVLIPEKIILAHTENEWNELKINLDNVIDEEEEERKRLKDEKLKFEEEAKLEKARLTKLYPMNKHEIIKMVNKSFKKKSITHFSVNMMRKEYLDIVIAKKLESQEWIDYHIKLQSGITK